MLYFDKIEMHRKQRGMSVSGLCRLSGVSRITYWAWKTKKQIPTNENIRKLAKALDVPVQYISDLQEVASDSENKLADMIDSWMTLTEMNDQSYQHDIDNVLSTVKSLNNKLNQSVVIIKALLESMQTLFYIKDSQLRYLTANKAFLRNLSLPDNYHILNKTDLNFFSKADAKKINEQDKQILTTGIPLLRVEELIPGSNHKKWGLTSKFPIYDAKNKIIGVIGTFIDITDRKKAEERREILEKAIDLMVPSLTIYDCEKEKVIFLSKEKIEAQTGYSAEKFLGANGNSFYAKNILHPEDKDAFKKEFIIKNGNKSRTLEFRTINSKGEVRSNIAVDSYINISGKDYIVGLTTDSTEEKKSEEKQNAFTGFLNSEDNGIAIVDLDNDKFTFINNSFRLVTGYEEEDFFYKKKFTEIIEILLNKDEKEAFLKAMEISSNSKITKKFVIIRSDKIQTEINAEFKRTKINEQNYLFLKMF